MICTSSLNAPVVAETVQKILDVKMFLDKKLSAARYFGMEPQEMEAIMIFLLYAGRT